MTVYVVLEDFGYEGYDEPVIAFDSEEKASSYVLEHIKDLHNPLIIHMEVK